MNPRFGDLVVTKWGARFMGREFPCAIGRSGIRLKQGEGDGITPIGTFLLGGIRTRPDRVTLDAGALSDDPIGLFDIWSDDPKDPDYNHGLTKVSHPFSHEKLRRSDGLYDCFAIVDYNWPDAVSGAGSAIFLHVFDCTRRY